MTWRDDIRMRLHKAIDWCAGDKPLSVTHQHHMRSFARKLRSAGAQYKNEIEKLSPIEFSLYIISSTDKKLEGDEDHFTAYTVRDILFPHLPFLKKERWNEIEEALSKMQQLEVTTTYRKLKNNQNR